MRGFQVYFSLDSSTTRTSNDVMITKLISIIAVYLVSQSLCRADEAIKIKGLYIGMKVQDATDVLNKRFREYIGVPPEFQRLNDGSYSLWVTDRDTNLPLLSLKGDNNGTVIEVVMLRRLVDKMFNTADQDFNAFVKQFKNAYKIPEMKPFTHTEFGLTDSGYEFSSPTGVRIRISESKAINMALVPTVKERKFD